MPLSTKGQKRDKTPADQRMIMSPGSMGEQEFPHNDNNDNDESEPLVPESFPSHTDIAQRAYELYVEEGFLEGRALEHWLQAERELRSR